MLTLLIEPLTLPDAVGGCFDTVVVLESGSQCPADSSDGGNQPRKRQIVGNRYRMTECLSEHFWHQRDAGRKQH
jgi:hypothetical protein